MRLVIILALSSQLTGSAWTLAARGGASRPFIDHSSHEARPHAVGDASTRATTSRAGAQERTAQPTAFRAEVETLNAAMVAAFKTNPATVADFYTDDARIMGGGQAYQGRQEIAAYWAQATMFVDWTLEIIEVGGSSDAPWQLGRSVLTGKSGRTMETHFVGILERQPDGRLKFKLDMFTQANAKIRAPGAAVDESERAPR